MRNTNQVSRTPKSGTLDDSTMVAQTLQAGFNYQIHKTANSLWLVSVWPSGERTAFRILCAGESPIEELNLREHGRSLSIIAIAGSGRYTVKIAFSEKKEHSVRYFTTFEPESPFVLNLWPVDIVPLAAAGGDKKASFRVHGYQIDSKSCKIYLSQKDPMGGAIFYRHDTDALSLYCETSSEYLAGALRDHTSCFGLSLSAGRDKALVPGIRYILSAALIIFSDELPAKGISTMMFSKLIARANMYQSEMHDICSMAKGSEQIATSKLLCPQHRGAS